MYNLIFGTVDNWKYNINPNCECQKDAMATDLVSPLAAKSAAEKKNMAAKWRRCRRKNSTANKKLPQMLGLREHFVS